MVLLGFAIGFAICLLLWRFAALKSDHKRQGKRISVDTFAKLIVVAAMTHGMLLTTLSYILAFYERDPVCSVSEVIVKEILAPVIIYLATNTIMNIFEKNKLAFSVPISTTVVGSDGKTHTYSGVTETIIDEPDENNAG